MNFDKHFKTPAMRSIKLSSGEEIVAMVNPDDDDMVLKIFHPFAVRMVPSKANMVFGIFPWLVAASTDFVILNKSAVISISDVKSEIIDVYMKAINMFSTQVERANSNDMVDSQPDPSSDITENQSDDVQIKKRKKKDLVN